MQVSLTRSGALALLAWMFSGCGGSFPGGSSGEPSSGGPAAVTFTFTGTPPGSVAAAIGSGGFTSQAPNSGRLTLFLPTGVSTFAVAISCSQFTPNPYTGGNSNTEQILLQASIADGTSFTLPCLGGQSSGLQTGLLTGSVDATELSGVTGVSVLATDGNWATSTDLSGLASGFSLTAPAGNDRVMVLGYAGSNLAAAKGFDNQVIPGALNGGNTVVLSPADETSNQPITYQDVPSGFGAPNTNVTLNVAGLAGFSVASGATNAYPTLPPGALETGDSYLFQANTFQTLANGNTNGVAAYATLAVGGPVTLSFPTPWSYPGPTWPNSYPNLPTFDFSYAGFSHKTAITYAAELFWADGLYANNSWSSLVLSTANYQNGSTIVTFPDLSAFGIVAPDEPPYWQATIICNGYGLQGIIEQLPPISVGAAVQSSGSWPR